MTYSLVSTATLGFDLVRLPGGRPAAEVLLRALSAGPAELAHLAAHHARHDASGDERLALAVRGRRARELAATGAQRLAGVAAASSGDEPLRPAALAAQLEASMIGDVASLERLLRDDALAPLADGAGELAGDERDLAADVLADAAVAAYAAAQLPVDLRRALSAPWSAASAAMAPLDPDLGPRADAVRAVLAHVREGGAAGCVAWGVAVDVERSQRRAWAQAMHSACWAAHVSGRTRSVAAAVLMAVLACEEAGLSAGQAASGTWNAIAGVVQAVAVADLLDSESLDVLLAVWHHVGGALALDAR